jgi:hypothetical protein
MATAIPVTPPDSSGGSTGSTGMSKVFIDNTPVTPGGSVEIYNYTLSRQINITATKTIGDYNSILVCDASGAAIVLTFPSGKAAVGKMLIVAKTDATGNSVTITGISGETIFAPAGFSGLTTQYATVTFIGVVVGTTGGWMKVD